ncbi:hypothetical protein MRB53_025682 [Persea americana]|uniref:Uncharacterized protein n=1 Tax=Persea americana TaxID=3435 RepID=A0ACC2LGL1_PERAE|nr:hypothetical protein MRB53_025682 [Persea americana]
MITKKGEWKGRTRGREGAEKPRPLNAYQNSSARMDSMEVLWSFSSGIAPHRCEAALPVPLVTGKLLESSPRVAGVRVVVAILVRRWSGSVSRTRTRGSRQVKKGCPFSLHLRTVAAC